MHHLDQETLVLRISILDMSASQVSRTKYSAAEPLHHGDGFGRSTEEDGNMAEGVKNVLLRLSLR